VETAPVIIFVGLLVFLAHLFVVLFERTRVPDVLYLIAIGVAIGPVLNIVTPEDFGKVGHVFTMIALAIILFEGGLELSIETLRASLRSTVILALVSYFVSGALVTAVLMALLPSVELPVALFVGAVLAAPAPAVVIPLIRQLALEPGTRATLTLEAPLGEAFGIVIALAVLDSLGERSLQVGPFLGRLVSSFLVALLIGGIGGYAWSIVLHKIRELRHAVFTTPSFILVLFGMTEFLGFSGAVSALTFGVMLGNPGLVRIPWISERFKVAPLHHNEVEKAFFGELVFLIKTFFFVYLGLSVRLTDVSVVGIALVLVGALLVGRLLSVRASTRRGTPVRDALLMGVLVPKGTAAAVLASIPLQMGIAHGEQIQNSVYAVIVASILFTGFLVFLLERGIVRPLLGILFRGYGPQQGAPDPERGEPVDIPST
jgi:NhaP-type Na+/H+ or K+/H+ antiporter